MLKTSKNSRYQGNQGLGKAIAYFTSQGYVVSIPLNDSQSYDLVVDNGRELDKVQVRTTYHKKRSGAYEVGLRTMGGNKSGNTIKLFDSSCINKLFILTDDGNTYLIPSEVILNKNSITISGEYVSYRVDIP